MIRRSKTAIALLALVGLFALAQDAAAVSLIPGSTVTPIANADAVGTLIDFTGLINFSSPGGIVLGTLAAAVYDDGNGLDFYYQVFNYQDGGATPGNEPYSRVSNFSFGGFTTDVVYRTDAPDSATTKFTAAGAMSIAPTTADRTAAPGNTVGFNFPIPSPPLSTPGQIPAGFYSNVLVIRTNAVHYTFGNTGISDGGTANVTTFAPTIVPEPGSMMLFGTGLVGLARLVRRRRAGATASNR